MKRLEITDLSFCETELEDSDKVNGGISSFFSLIHPFYSKFLLPIQESEVEVLEQSVGKNGEIITYFADQETNISGLQVSNETGSGKAVSTVITGNFSGGDFVRSSAFASS